MQQILIAGIDPGTTAAYAFLDGKGRPVDLKSSKKANLDFMLREATKNGDVVLVGTDKRKCPGLIQKFATKLGIKVIKPEKDLTIREKNLLIKSFKTRNEHEADALAAAMYAYKQTNPLLTRIDALLRKAGKEELSEQTKKIVLKKGINIKKTIDELEKNNFS